MTSGIESPIQRLGRRGFLTSAASGTGLLALAHQLAEGASGRDPLEPKAAHGLPKAKACICIYLEGGPSQMDLFDPKPKLNELHGQKLPESLTQKVRFAFIQKEGARVLGSPRKFSRHGQCGMELSDLLPYLSRHADDMALIRSMHTEAFNHHPGQLLMNTGAPVFGRPSMGAWLNYGLGSLSRDLPGYVVLSSGRGTSGGTSNWGSGFLPSTYQGVLFRNQGEPILNLQTPDGITPEMHRAQLDAVRQLNQLKELFPEASVHAFTATATEQVRQDIVEQLGLHNPLVLVGNFDRPNLTYRIIPRDDLMAQ